MIEKIKNRGEIDEVKARFGVKTDQQLADMVGISYSAVSKWLERGIPPKHKLQLEKMSSSIKQSTTSSAHRRAAVIHIPRLIIHARGGQGAHLEGIEDFPTEGTVALDTAFFRVEPPATLFAICVDGYSMAPMVLPGSWIIFDAAENEYKGDGLYILNWRNELMVKVLQVDPRGQLHIKSANKDYDSWIVDPDDQSVFRIVGRVIKILM
ncbi:MAG: helix-turn-helix domain-containing protein [Helicobacteraceae bacterium]|nr:helix-turn-helix domain-containing protein [Helicobacteraceae bacterium]